MIDHKYTNSSNIPNFWAHSEPNGDQRENCVAQVHSLFLDIYCGKELCGICDLESSPIFVMRGFCKKAKFDLHYGWTGDLSAGTKYNFR